MIGYLRHFMNNCPNWEEVLAASPYYLRIVHDGPFVLLKYQPWQSTMQLPLVQEARGTIMVMRNGYWEYACMAIPKFFNAGEPEAATPWIEWKNCEAVEKIDGSLIKVWNWRGTWHVSTNGSIAADHCCAPSGKTYLELVEEIVPIEDLVFSLDPRYCYWFELVGPENRIVVPYKDAALYYLGCRNMVNLEESRMVPKLPAIVKYPERRKATSLNEIIAAVAQWQTIEHEGFVVVDSRWNRIKVKSEAYVAAHHARQNGILTTESIVEMWQNDSLDDYLALYSENRVQIENAVEAIHTTADKMEWWFQEALEQGNRKSIALWMNQNHAPGIASAYVFARLDNKVDSALEYLHSYNNLRRLI